MCEIAIIGAGGHAREQLDLIAALNAQRERFSVVGILVEPGTRSTVGPIDDVPILGDLDWLRDRDMNVVCAVGNPALRRRLAARAVQMGARFPTLVHPDAKVGRRVTLGAGALVGAGVVITCDVRIGANVHVNVGATISHDCELDAYATLAPGAHIAGAVRIGEGAEIGVGAIVSDRVAIGEWAILGAGAVAVRDVAANVTAVGVPARVIATRKAGWQFYGEACGADGQDA
jgi:sugar O-acyltransferase (sialic acid O-acetyltransferase NeuD family)